MSSRAYSIRFAGPHLARRLVWLNLALASHAGAATTTYFHSNQVATVVSTGTTSDTISSEGYLFTYTRDKLFTGGVGLTNPIGRTVRVPWPQGIEAQAVTAGPNPSGAQLTIKRVGGGLFDLPSFTLRLLANTAGAGATLEIMPQRNGEDLMNDPVFFFASGYYGSQFSYDTAGGYQSSTLTLTNADTYKVSLYVDFAFTALTLHNNDPASNHAPTGITASGLSVFENDPAGTWIGTLDAIDPDPGDTFTYALSAGVGGSDNALFEIQGGDLFTTASFNYELRTNYSIRVTATDQGMLATQQVFVIEVLDVSEPPPEFMSDTTLADRPPVLRWLGLPNHTYTVLQSTNLLEGFSVAQSNIPADAVMNVYTDATPAVSAKFWKLLTEP